MGSGRPTFIYKWWGDDLQKQLHQQHKHAALSPKGRSTKRYRAENRKHAGYSAYLGRGGLQAPSVLDLDIFAVLVGNLVVGEMLIKALQRV